MKDQDFDILSICELIEDDTLKFVRKEIEKQQSKKLFLLIDTPGGIPEIGYRIMRLLNAKYDVINVVVPNKAMSTGTLMALGSDRIYMFHSSSLGPLDLQIEHPNDGSWISTLDVRDTMNTIISHSEVAARRIFAQNYRDFGLGKVDAAKIASQNAQELIKPIVDKIDPYHLHKSFRSAAVGEKYAAILLKTRMHKGVPGVADSVSAKLANDYSTHGYAITIDEARDSLFLDVFDLGDLDVWNEIEQHFTQTRKRVDYKVRKAQTETNETKALLAKPRPGRSKE